MIQSPNGFNPMEYSQCRQPEAIHLQVPNDNNNEYF